jgi:hypothetical protein
MYSHEEPLEHKLPQLAHAEVGVFSSPRLSNKFSSPAFLTNRSVIRLRSCTMIKKSQNPDF